MENLKKEYRNLEMRVLANLRYKISISTQYSDHLEGKCIKVNIGRYTELANVNHTLIFMDKKGLHYSVFDQCTLEDLIDILNTK